MLGHITIFLPIAYRGGSLRVTKTIAKMIRLGSKNTCGVRIAIIKDAYDLESEFNDVFQYGIDVREFTWSEINAQDVDFSNKIQGRSKKLDHKKYYLPTDGVDNFMGSDLWFVVSDRLFKPLAPIRPNVIFATDYIQRYVPDIFPRSGWGTIDLTFLQAVRDADAVITTTPQTRKDVISYVGVPASKVHLAPMDFDPTAFPEMDQTSLTLEKYIIWPTNPTPHKNHVRAFEALERYLGSLNGNFNIKIVGPNTKWLDPEQALPEWLKENPHLTAARKVLETHVDLVEKIQFLGEVSDDEYASLVSNAQFMWHPTLIDNGTYAVAEAAWFKCPALSSGYPQMRYIGERFSIPMKYFNARSVHEMAKSLRDMETEIDKWKSQLPSQERLAKHSWEFYSTEYWSMLQEIAA